MNRTTKLLAGLGAVIVAGGVWLGTRGDKNAPKRADFEPTAATSGVFDWTPAPPITTTGQPLQYAGVWLYGMHNVGMYRTNLAAGGQFEKVVGQSGNIFNAVSEQCYGPTGKFWADATYAMFRQTCGQAVDSQGIAARPLHILRTDGSALRWKGHVDVGGLSATASPYAIGDDGYIRASSGGDCWHVNLTLATGSHVPIPADRRPCPPEPIGQDGIGGVRYGLPQRVGNALRFTALNPPPPVQTATVAPGTPIPPQASPTCQVPAPCPTCPPASTTAPPNKTPTKKPTGPPIVGPQ